MFLAVFAETRFPSSIRPDDGLEATAETWGYEPDP
jgi:hypothetical protein